MQNRAVYFSIVMFFSGVLRRTSLEVGQLFEVAQIGATRMMTNWNKSPVGIQDEIYVDSIFLVEMNFKVGSLGSSLEVNFGVWGKCSKWNPCSKAKIEVSFVEVQFGYIL